MKINKASLAGIVATYMGLLGIASAQIVNGSFETGTVGTSGNPVTDTGVATGWTLTGNVIVQQFDGLAGNPNYDVGVTNGVRALDFNPSNSAPNAVVSQTFATVAGAVYTLSFDFGKYGTASAGPALTGSAALFVSVSGASADLAQTVSDSTGSSYDLAGGPSETFSPYSFSFTADNALTTLSFTDVTDSNGTSFDAALDNVAVTPNSPSVPEPSTWALMLGGFGILFLVARHRNSLLG